MVTASLLRYDYDKGRASLPPLKKHARDLYPGTLSNAGKICAISVTASMESFGRTAVWIQSPIISMGRRFVQSCEQMFRRNLEDIACAQDGREGHGPSRFNLLPVPR
jgi:hypothetical protein